MKLCKRIPRIQWASIHQSEKFISVEPLSGSRRGLPEDESYVIYLEPCATDEALGGALLEALNRSRFVDPTKERGFFKGDRVARADERWHQDFMTRYGYETKRQAYKNMRYCRAKRCEGKISIEPHRRDKPQYWWDLPADRTVVIPATTDPIAAGAALKLALSRCE